MKYFLSALFPLALPQAAFADRIADMNRTEPCTYTAKLQVAGYYDFCQSRLRDQVRIHGHGDETQYEIDFIAATLDQAYDWLTNAGVIEPTPGDQAFGDMVYESCMSRCAP